MPEHAQPLETWAVVEVMGHKKFAGYVSEQVIGGAALVRVDVPETDQGGVFTKPYTKLIGVGSIYCITPTTEEIARRAAQQLERWNNPIPVDIVARPQIPATSSASFESDAELVDEGDDEDDREAWQG
jgi:hypothetical protein